MEPVWIDRTDALVDWLDAASGEPLALDTEADSLHHYREKVCLVQLSAAGRHALVDPLAGVDLAPLAAPLAEPARLKILHGADYDVRLLERDCGLVFSGLTDTMIAARLLGEPAVGLQALLLKYLEVTLDKSQQRADWSKRPLSSAMRAYAVEDTRHLAALWAMLHDRLDALGRAGWVREECERLCSVRWRERRNGDPEAFRRTKGARDLDPAALAVLRELWSWRELTAAERDRPPFRILRDEVLVEMARSKPLEPSDLARIAGFPAPLRAGAAASELLERVRAGASVPDELRPARIATEPVRPDPAVVAEVKHLRERRDRIAADLALDPAIVASRALLEELAARRLRGDDPWSAPELRNWQAELLRPAS